METIDNIRRFLGTGYGDGDGDGDGDGYGDGYGYGYGDGDGYGYGYGYGSGSGSGYGYGYGDGSGDGSGYGDGIKSFNGQRVYIVDDTQTLIDSVHGNSACGHILKDDLTLQPCYIAKVGNFFAHGGTLKEARDAAQAKYDENRPLEERMNDFVNTYPSLDMTAPCRELYNWHHILTGSCDMGRREFCNAHGIDMEKDYTIRYFLDVTSNDYGKDAIRQVREKYDGFKKGED